MKNFDNSFSKLGEVANPNLTIDEVKQLEIQREFDNRNTLVGTALQDSEEWAFQGNAITIPVKNPISPYLYLTFLHVYSYSHPVSQA